MRERASKCASTARIFEREKILVLRVQRTEEEDPTIHAVALNGAVLDDGHFLPLPEIEVDPLQCKKCGSAMKIKSFIQDPDEISRITKHLGLSWRAPPPLGVNYPNQPYYDYSEEYIQ